MVHRAVSIKVTGRVQGVWFRVSTRKEADKLNIRGIVRNEPDGSVYIEAVGTPEAIEAFINWCRRGPELALVRDVQVSELSHFPLFADFNIVR